MFKNLEQLIKKIKKQKNKNPKISYTASLIKKGKNFCIKKFMEEAKEFAISSKYSNKKNLIHEATDVLYHYLVLLESKKISFRLILKEIKKRSKTSGIIEKLHR
jgi:phosphoribosyl-ATP pyrophosphohydrolase